MPEEIKTLRQLLADLATKPTPPKFYKFHQRIVERIEEQDAEISKLKKIVSRLDHPTTIEAPELKAVPA